MSTFNLLDQFSSALRNKKVGIVEFAESDEYCQKPLYPRQRVLLKLIWLEEMEGWEEDILTEWIQNPRGEVIISPNIRERRQRLIDEGYPHFREVVLVGGRRSSKGHMTGLSIAKKAWDMIALDNPQQHYGIDRDKQIYSTIIAASEEQAKRYQYADARAAILSCVSMGEYIDQVLERHIGLFTPGDLVNQSRFDSLNKKIKVPSSIRVRASAANAATVRGEATIIAVLDEMAHMMEGVSSKSSADEIYEAITPALDQFGKDALIFENSSPYTKIGKFFENYCKAMDIDLDSGEKLDHTIDYRAFAFQYPSWELYRDRDKDPKKRFKKVIVAPPYEEEWMNDEEKGMANAMQIEERVNPEKFSVERRAHFAEVMEGFLDPKKVDQVFAPFQWEGGEDRLLKSRFDRQGFGPEVIFKAHGDPATTTANFGFAIGHLEYNGDQPHVVFDFIHAWIPGEQEENTINFLDVQEEILEWVIRFRPKECTFDQYQSNSLINWLRRESAKRAGGVIVREVVATEKLNFKRAENFKTAINLGLVHAPNDNRFASLAKNELKFLQKRGNRIVKQEVGPVQTKDVADCLMEVVDSLIGSYVSNFTMPTEMAKGGKGGYNYLEGESNRDRISKFYNRGAPTPRQWGAKPIKQVKRYR